MWLTDLIQLRSHLIENNQLLQEQNKLLRELILAASGHPARTPVSSHSSTSTPTPRLAREYTADDVFRVTPERRAELDQRAKDTIRAPWRHPMETLRDIDEKSVPGVGDPTRSAN